MADYNSIIDSVREERIKEVEVPGKEGAPLLGECFKNAFALAEELFEQGHSPYIVTGGLDFEREPAPSTAKEARELGQHHFWVYVDGTHLDISGEWLGSSKEGSPIIDSSPPDHYITYHKTKFSPSKTSEKDYL